jgi:zinc/manganese transport system substrate-binding protein
MGRPRLFLFFLALVVPAAAQPLVLTTSPVLQDLVRQVGGASVRVECLVPAGTSGPDFEPTPETARRLHEAGMLVVNGSGNEPWLDELLQRSDYAGAVVVATEGLPLLDLDGQWHAADSPVAAIDQDDFDPYAWHDPRNVIRYVENIRAGLARLLPTREGEYRIRTNSYTGELQNLHAYAVEQFGSIPADRRRLVTSLASLHYFAAAYGLRIVRIPGLASGQELRPGILGKLVDTITRLRAPAVFFEPTANARTIKRIADATKARIITSLYTDGLGPAGSAAGTYLGMFRANVDTIVVALK